MRKWQFTMTKTSSKIKNLKGKFRLNIIYFSGLRPRSQSNSAILVALASDITVQSNKILPWDLSLSLPASLHPCLPASSLSLPWVSYEYKLRLYFLKIFINNGYSGLYIYLFIKSNKAVSKKMGIIQRTFSK